MNMAVIKSEKLSVSPDDLLAMGDAGKGWELIHGQLVERPMSTESSRVAVELIYLLLHHCRHHQPGWVFGSDLGFRCFGADQDTVRCPHVSYISTQTLPVESYEEEGYCTVVPDLVAEVISPNDKAADMQSKIAQWLSAGVKAVWVVYPSSQTLLAYSADGTIRQFHAEETVTAETLLPGFKLTLADLFRKPKQVEQKS